MAKNMTSNISSAALAGLTMTEPEAAPKVEKKEEPKKETVKINESKKEVKKEDKKDQKEERIKLPEKAAKTEKKVGRPKADPYIKTSIMIPSELSEYVDIAAGLFHKGNKSEYIKTLIEKDIKEKKKVYDSILDARKG